MSQQQNNGEKNNYSSSEENINHGKGLIVFLLLLSILTNLATGYYISTGASKTGGVDTTVSAFMEKYLVNEYEKAGGKENYDLLAKAQQLQMEDQIPQIKQFIASKQGASPTTNTISAGTGIASAGSNTLTSAKTLSQEEIASIKKYAYIEGNNDAPITIIEYDDLECPFCIRQFKDGVIKQVRDKYGDKVNSIFKNFRGVPHENSETEAAATLCAGDTGGKNAYVSYYNAIFTRTNGGNGTGFSRDALLPLAKELKLDGKKFQECIDSKKEIARFDRETAEGSKLGVQGTPGNVIINNKTGEYELIAGAYPISEFERVIDKLLK